MAVAFDAETETAVITSITTTNTTHTPVGTPKAVVVAVITDSGVTAVSAVTYGGVALTTSVAQNHTVGNTGTVMLWFLGAGIPTGSQTVAITTTTASATRATITTLTAGGDCTVDTTVAGDIPSAAPIQNPSLTLTFTGTLDTAACFYALHSSNGTVENTPQAGSTQQFPTTWAIGGASGLWGRKVIASAASTTMGWSTASTIQGPHVALAVKEVAVADNTTKPGMAGEYDPHLVARAWF